MRNIKRKVSVKRKLENNQHKDIDEYGKQSCFDKKDEEAKQLLEKVGLPDSFKVKQ